MKEDEKDKDADGWDDAWQEAMGSRREWHSQGWRRGACAARAVLCRCRKGPSAQHSMPFASTARVYNQTPPLDNPTRSERRRLAAAHPCRLPRRTGFHVLRRRTTPAAARPGRHANASCGQERWLWLRARRRGGPGGGGSLLCRLVWGRAGRRAADAGGGRTLRGPAAHALRRCADVLCGGGGAQHGGRNWLPHRCAAWNEWGWWGSRCQGLPALACMCRDVSRPAAACILPDGCFVHCP